MSKKPPGGGGGHSHKHSGNHPPKHQPHHGSHKHNPGHHKQPHGGPGGPPIVVKGPGHHHAHGRRQWSPGSDVACCSAEALGLLLGWGWDEVLGLYWRTASDPDSGATILDTLKAAPVVRPAGVSLGHPAGCCPPRGRTTGAGLILGVALPEPHAVAVTPDGTWWSWGQPFNPDAWPELVVEEAWAVSWQ